MVSWVNHSSPQDQPPWTARLSGPLRRLLPVGVELRSPLGRGLLARVAVWAVLVVLALSAVAALFTAAHAVRLAALTRDSNLAGAAAGPTGWAESYVAVFVSAGVGAEGRLKPFLADPPQLETKPDSVRVTRTAVVDARRVEVGYWSVTVAADLVASGKQGRQVRLGTRYYRVGVIAAGHGFVATGLPAQVAAPALAATPRLAYGGTPLAVDDPVVGAVAHFVDAFLAGRGELARYVAPQTGLVPITPAPFVRATLTEVTAARGAAVNRGDKTVLAQVRAVDSGGGVQQLTYPLRLALLGGQWVVTAMDVAPMLIRNGGVR